LDVGRYGFGPRFTQAGPAVQEVSESDRFGGVDAITTRGWPIGSVSEQPT
jgi:hypothetical protein